MLTLYEDTLKIFLPDNKIQSLQALSDMSQATIACWGLVQMAAYQMYGQPHYRLALKYELYNKIIKVANQLKECEGFVLPHSLLTVSNSKSCNIYIHTGHALSQKG
jgi:hypothetical protein